MAIFLTVQCGDYRGCRNTVDFWHPHTKKSEIEVLSGWRNTAEIRASAGDERGVRELPITRELEQGQGAGNVSASSNKTSVESGAVFATTDELFRKRN